MGDGRRIEVEPVAGALGAEVTGVDLSQPLGDADFAALRRAFLEHLVLFFRDQRLTPEQLKAFTLRWGDFGSTPFVRTMDEHPEIIEVLKEADERRTANFGGSWHSDFSFQPEPPMATLLYAQEVPRCGGLRLFANQYMAYERPTAGLRGRLDALNAVHSDPAAMLSFSSSRFRFLVSDISKTSRVDSYLCSLRGKQGGREGERDACD